MHVRLLALMTLAAASMLVGTACRNRDNLATKVMDDPTRSLASARCGGTGKIIRPLIIEWPATDRASLEGRLGRGLVVVRYEGCVVEVMRECSAPEAKYDYVGITRKHDRITIRDSDELYANLPLTAVELEAKLAKAGELNVAMALVGNYEAQRARFDISELEGRCDGATHIIAAAQVGAFEFYAGSGAEIGTSVEVENVAGVGGRSTASREMLNRDGDATACEKSAPGDSGPPAECGALLRLELAALDGITPTCQPGSVWNGSSCVAQAPAGDTRSRPDRTSPSTPDRAATDTTPPGGSELAQQSCVTMMACDAQTAGTVLPEGKTYERLFNTCVRMFDPMLNDYTRPIARQCLANFEGDKDCSAFASCMGVGGDPSFDDPSFDNPSAPISDDSSAMDGWGDSAWADETGW